MDNCFKTNLKEILKFPSKVKKNKDFYSLDCTNNRVNLDLIEYFYNSFKGIKSLQYSIWSRSLRKSNTILSKKEKKEYLKNIQDKLRNLIKKDQSI